MYKILILALLCFFTLQMEAQELTGVIEYETTMTMDPNDMPPERRRFMEGRPGEDRPKERKRKTILSFDESGSIHKAKPRDPNEESSDGDRRRRRRGGRRGGGSILYKSMESGNTVEQKSIMGKNFIIKSEDLTRDWKMTGRQEQISGYMCMEATTLKDSTLITAWFTPQIPVSVGPGEFHDLPGAILKIYSENNRFSTVATSVNLDVEVQGIEAPTKGDVVSEEEFEKIRKEKMEQMREMYGRRGGRGSRGGR